MKSYKYEILTGRSISKILRIHCMEKHDYEPQHNVSFSFMGDADLKLITVAQMTDKSNKYLIYLKV